MDRIAKQLSDVTGVSVSVTFAGDAATTLRVFDRLLMLYDETWQVGVQPSQDVWRRVHRYLNVTGVGHLCPTVSDLTDLHRLPRIWSALLARLEQKHGRQQLYNRLRKVLKQREILASRREAEERRKQRAAALAQNSERPCAFVSPKPRLYSPKPRLFSPTSSAVGVGGKPAAVLRSFSSSSSLASQSSASGHHRSRIPVLQSRNVIPSGRQLARTPATGLRANTTPGVTRCTDSPVRSPTPAHADELYSLTTARNDESRSPTPARNDESRPSAGSIPSGRQLSRTPVLSTSASQQQLSSDSRDSVVGAIVYVDGGDDGALSQSVGADQLACSGERKPLCRKSPEVVLGEYIERRLSSGAAEPKEAEGEQVGASFPVAAVSDRHVLVEDAYQVTVEAAVVEEPVKKTVARKGRKKRQPEYSSDSVEEKVVSKPKRGRTKKAVDVEEDGGAAHTKKTVTVEDNGGAPLDEFGKPTKRGRRKKIADTAVEMPESGDVVGTTAVQGLVKTESSVMESVVENVDGPTGNEKQGQKQTITDSIKQAMSDPPAIVIAKPKRGKKKKEVNPEVIGADRDVVRGNKSRGKSASDELGGEVSKRRGKKKAIIGQEVTGVLDTGSGEGRDDDRGEPDASAVGQQLGDNLQRSAAPEAELTKIAGPVRQDDRVNNEVADATVKTIVDLVAGEQCSTADVDVENSVINAKQPPTKSKRTSKKEKGEVQQSEHVSVNDKLDKVRRRKVKPSAGDKFSGNKLDIESDINGCVPVEESNKMSTKSRSPESLEQRSHEGSPSVEDTAAVEAYSSVFSLSSRLQKCSAAPEVEPTTIVDPVRQDDRVNNEVADATVKTIVDLVAGEQCSTADVDVENPVINAKQPPTKSKRTSKKEKGEVQQSEHVSGNDKLVKVRRRKVKPSAGDKFSGNKLDIESDINGCVPVEESNKMSTKSRSPESLEQRSHEGSPSVEDTAAVEAYSSVFSLSSRLQKRSAAPEVEPTTIVDPVRQDDRVNNEVADATVKTIVELVAGEQCSTADVDVENSVINAKQPPTKSKRTSKKEKGEVQQSEHVSVNDKLVKVRRRKVKPSAGDKFSGNKLDIESDINGCVPVEESNKMSTKSRSPESLEQRSHEGSPSVEDTAAVEAYSSVFSLSSRLQKRSAAPEVEPTTIVDPVRQDDRVNNEVADATVKTIVDLVAGEQCSTADVDVENSVINAKQPPTKSKRTSKKKEKGEVQQSEHVSVNDKLVKVRRKKAKPSASDKYAGNQLNLESDITGCVPVGTKSRSPNSLEQHPHEVPPSVEDTATAGRALRCRKQVNYRDASPDVRQDKLKGDSVRVKGVGTVSVDEQRGKKAGGRRKRNVDASCDADSENNPPAAGAITSGSHRSNLDYIPADNCEVVVPRLQLDAEPSGVEKPPVADLMEESLGREDRSGRGSRKSSTTADKVGSRVRRLPRLRVARDSWDDPAGTAAGSGASQSSRARPLRTVN